eukprot:m.284044 g.284044  ORF g.284044 m.284044 type:complete len:263 (+) comp19897_c0_seq1:258-1046(+)
MVTTTISTVTAGMIASLLVIQGAFSSAVQPQAPDLPQQWIHGGVQVLGFPLPPWPTRTPVPSMTTRMHSAYDWTKHAMRETYHDACVPIFPHGSLWSCDFLNVNETSYLLQHDDRPQGQPECCVFLKPWLPPKPSFGGTLKFLKNTSESSIGGATVMWWQSVGVTPEQGGPFGYGWQVSERAGTSPVLTPYAFSFGGFWNWANGSYSGAYTVQYFSEFKAQKPPAETWTLPASCSDAQPCTNWPNMSQAIHRYANMHAHTAA